jgi:HlyD family secretion protein
MIVVSFMPKPVVVETATAKRGQLVVTVDEDGKSRVKDRYVVSAPLSGNLARIELRPGDMVKPGQILARLVPLEAPLLDTRSKAEAEARVRAAEASRRQAKAQIERAEAAYAFAKKSAQRAKQLSKDGVAPVADTDQALLEERARSAELSSSRFGAKVADYEAQMARAALGAMSGKKGAADSMDVPSPIAGRVLRVVHESEGVVQAGAPLVEVGDPSALEVVVDVLTSDAVRIKPGAHTEILRWGGAPLRAEVRLVEPSAFTRLSALGVEEQRVNAIVDLRDPYSKWTALMDGFRVEARIVVWEAQNALNIPASALFQSGDGFAVFVVDAEVAHKRTLKIGHNNGLRVEVLDGIAEGARIVVHPSDRVTDGARVTFR